MFCSERFSQKTFARNGLKIPTALLPRSNIRIVVPLHPVEKFFQAFWMSYVFYADIDTLLHITVADNFMHDSTDSAWRDIIHNAIVDTVEGSIVGVGSILGHHGWAWVRCVEKEAQCAIRRDAPERGLVRGERGMKMTYAWWES